VAVSVGSRFVADDPQGIIRSSDKSTLAGHSFSHELQVAADAEMLGSIDANRGEVQASREERKPPAPPMASNAKCLGKLTQ